MSARFRPVRPLRSEILLLVPVLLVLLVLYGLFPREVLRDAPHESVSSKPFCSFVKLSPESERRALAAARTSWQTQGGSSRHLRADLFVDALPATPAREVLDVAKRIRVDRAASAPYDPDLSLPTRAASAPERIAAQAEAGRVRPVFSREELLKLN